MKIPKPVKPIYGTTTRGSGLNRLIKVFFFTVIFKTSN